MFAHPRSRVPLGRTFSTPPNNMHNMAFFMYSCPWMDGASDLLSNSNISTFLLWASFLHFWTSSLVIKSVDSSLSCDMLLASRIVLKETNEEHYATANKWRTLCNCKQMKHIMQLQINEEHYATANKWSTLCNCKQMKNTIQLQTNEAHYATANKSANDYWNLWSIWGTVKSWKSVTKN